MDAQEPATDRRRAISGALCDHHGREKGKDIVPCLINRCFSGINQGTDSIQPCELKRILAS